MKSTRKHTSRSEQIRTHWRDHIAAQQVSGQTQAAYCRAQDLNTKYFYLWKNKLRAESTAQPSTPEKPELIPVLLASDLPPRETIRESDASLNIFLKATLPNGIGIECQLASETELCSMLSRLAQLPC